MNSLDFLFELYTEEIPASYQVKAIGYIRENLPKALDENKIERRSFEVGGTCRRVFIYIASLAEFQKTWEEEVKGPPKRFCQTESGGSTPQLTGFAKKVGVPPEQVRFKKDSQAEYSYVVRKQGGVSSLKILGAILPGLFLNIPFPKSMRWGDKKILYARPILHYFCCYLSENRSFSKENPFWLNVPASCEITLDHITREKVSVANAHDYFASLKKNQIIVREEERLAFLKESLASQAKKEDLELALDEGLLNEVNFLVEKPRVLTGTFSESFLALPDLVIISEMQEHQKYFPLRKKTGGLANRFLIVANVHSHKKSVLQTICKNNQKVLASRLKDGAFFFEEDRKRSLFDHVGGLKNVIHQEKTGSMFDKKERMKRLAEIILKTSSLKTNANTNYERACDLAKADLTTHLVYEFDHLQGEIGAIYAKLDAEEDNICSAIREHYLPRFQGDDHPTSPLGILISLSDKLDNLICSFLMGKKPTATQDPLGVRRQTIHTIETILKNKISFSVPTFLDAALKVYEKIVQKQALPARKIATDIWIFFRARFAAIFEKEGFDKKLVQASLSTKDHDICRLYSKMSALRALKNDDSFTDLILIFKRMDNILQDYLQKNKLSGLKEKVNEDKLFQKEERSLYELGTRLESMLTSKKSEKYYENIFSELARSGNIVDSFFDHIMVMHEDKYVQMNRLALLNYVTSPIKELFNLDILK